MTKAQYALREIEKRNVLKNIHEKNSLMSTYER